MRNSAEAQARDAAIDATHQIAYVEGASDYLLVKAQADRRRILDGDTLPEEYSSVAAYYRGAAAALGVRIG